MYFGEVKTCPSVCMLPQIVQVYMRVHLDHVDDNVSFMAWQIVLRIDGDEDNAWTPHTSYFFRKYKFVKFTLSFMQFKSSC